MTTPAKAKTSLPSQREAPGLKTDVQTSSEPTLYETFCRPELGQLLRTLALDVEYVSASGDELTTKHGKTVLDFLGGYGSTILGHNPIAIRQILLQALDQGLPIHAQASARVEAGKLARDLNDLFVQRFGSERGKFVSLFLATGTEAVEAAIKHALMSWNQRKQTIDRRLEKLENSLLQQQNLPPSTQNRAALRGLHSLREKLQAAKPILLALEGSYHGKTAGSLVVTSNASYAAMYPSKAVEVVFIPRDATSEQIEELLESHRIELGEEGLCFSQVAAGFVEWIQGEGGIHPISMTTAQTLSRALSAENIPLISDEIQTGMYRTGKFLACEHLGVAPDYILLGKSLGGGYAKISSLSIREDIYVPEFGRLHTSTFADDDLSCRIAQETLRLLQDDRDIETRAESFETLLRSKISDLQKHYPGVLREIRGKGWMMGLEFDLDLAGQAPSLLHAINQTGYTLYALSSWLLHQKNIRVAATLNRACTLRFEPSSQISLDACHVLLDALGELTRLISEGRLAEVFSPTLTPDKVPADRLSEIVSPRRPLPRNQPKHLVQATFLSHLIHAEQAEALDPVFKTLSPKKQQEFLMEIAPLAGSITYHEQEIEGAQGQKVILQLRGITATSRFFEESIRNQDGLACQKVREAALQAIAEKTDVIGLGQFTSIVTDNGVALRDILHLSGNPPPALTTGNSLTVGLAYRAILRVLEERGRSLAQSRVAIIGAAGNICSVYAQLLAPDVAHLTLVHREPLEVSRKFQRAYEQILMFAGADPATLRFKTSTSHHLEDISDCDIVISGTNSTRQFIEPRHLKSGAIVLDIGVPSNIHPTVLKERTDVECFQGGYAALPLGQKLLSPLVPTSNGEIFACMAETLALALAGRKQSLSIGSLSRASVNEALALADAVGIQLGHLKRLAAF